MKKSLRLFLSAALMFAVCSNLHSASECYGVLGHWINQSSSFSDDEVEYDIKYDATNDYITFRLRPIMPGKEFDYARVETSRWSRDLTDGNDYERYFRYENQTDNRNWKTQGGESFVVFLYRFKGDGTTYRTSQNNNLSSPGIVKYEWGAVCETVANDSQNPTLSTAYLGTVSGSSIEIQVEASDNQSLPIARYTVTDKSTSKRYLVTDKSGSSTIVVQGLQPCTAYSFDVQARDYSGNLSAARTVNGTTEMYDESVNLLQGLAKSSFKAGRNESNAWRIADHQADNTSFDSGGDSDVSKIYVQADMGKSYIVGKLRIQWEANCPKSYQLMFSDDESNWRVYQYDEQPAYGANRDAYLFVDYDIKGERARYVRIQTLVPRNTNGGMTIWEVEVYGDGTCEIADTQAPTNISATQVGASANSVELQVSATDNSGDAVVHYEYDGLTYNADEYGYLMLKGFSPCESRTINLYARDKNGNRSAAKQLTVRAGAAAPDLNLAYAKSCTAGYNDGNAYRAVDKSGTLNDGWDGGGNTERDKDWIRIDLGDIYTIGEVRVQWENARIDEYRLRYSKNGTDWLEFHYDEAPEYSKREDNVYMSYPLYGLAARYVELKADHSTSNNGMYIWEIEVYGDENCYEADNQNPTIVGYTQVGEAGDMVKLQMNATDNQDATITKYFFDGYAHIAPNGLLTIENLVACGTYTYQMQAIDNAGNMSAPFTVVATTGEPAADQNLALKRIVYSGYDESDGLQKAHAVDGKSNTRWATTGRPTSNDEWLVIDLGQPFQINRIEVEWETGTSIHYEFKTAFDATFGTQWLDGVNEWPNHGYFDKILSGNFSTISRHSDLPSSAADEEHNDKYYPDQPKSVDVYDFSAEPVHGRFLKLESGLMADYATSLWEIRVYGECMETDDKPLMQWAEVIYASVDEAEIYVSALDKQTAEENMRYEVTIQSGDAGYRQTSYTMIYQPSDFINGESGRLLLEGLIPTVPYEVTIVAIDEDGNHSPNSRTINFTTSNVDGCVFSNSRAFNLGAATGNKSTQIFQKGYEVTITSETGKFIVVAHTDDNFYELNQPQFQVVDKSNPKGTMLHEHTMTKVDEQTYRTEINLTESYVSGKSEITFMVKYQFANGGICLTQPITYNITDGCPASFVIFHTDDAPSAEAITQYSGSSIDKPILYYRLFTPQIWEDLCMPFDVKEIGVYDTDEHQYYSLYAQTIVGGSTVPGYFLLRTQEDLVSGDDFVNGWHDGPDRLPQKGQPYNIRFWYDFYGSHYVVFKGDAQSLSSFSMGTHPTEDDQYQVYGNPTMMPQSVGVAYLLPEAHDEEIYRRQTNAVVRPFETYVLASTNTMARMRSIGRWNPLAVPDIDIEEMGNNDLTTGIVENQIEEKIEVYSLMGQHLMSLSEIAISEVTEQLRELSTGCYLLQAGERIYKVVVR